MFPLFRKKKRTSISKNSAATTVKTEESTKVEKSIEEKLNIKKHCASEGHDNNLSLPTKYNDRKSNLNDPRGYNTPSFKQPPNIIWETSLEQSRNITHKKFMQKQIDTDTLSLDGDNFRPDFLGCISKFEIINIMSNYLTCKNGIFMDYKNKVIDDKHKTGVPLNIAIIPRPDKPWKQRNNAPEYNSMVEYDNLASVSTSLNSGENDHTTKSDEKLVIESFIDNVWIVSSSKKQEI